VGYAEERIDLLGRLRKAAQGRTLAEALRLDGRTLRFHLGTSLADLRVPVHVDESVRGVLRTAVRDLFFLLSLRHRAALRENEYDQLILLDGFEPGAARQTSFNPPASAKSENVRHAFLEAPGFHPALDCGLVASWLTSGRPGRALAGTLNALLRRAHAETAGRDPLEPTSFLALLAIRSLSQEALATLRGFPISGPAGRALHGAVAAGLLLVVRLALREAGPLEGPFAAACEAMAAPLPWLGGLRSLWGSGFGGYGVAFPEGPANIDHYLHKLIQGGATEAVAAEVEADLVSSKEAMRKASRQVALARVRSDLLALVRMAEVGRAAPFSVEAMSLAQLYGSPGALERVLSAQPARKELYEKCRAGAKAATNDAAGETLDSLIGALKRWKDEDGGGIVAEEQIVQTWTAAVAALAADAALESGLDQAQGQLIHRQGTESEGGIETQHEAGKLYLFSLDDRPILKIRARALQMGHLFCDMKDFTKRTAFLKETVVADFLSREFYGPILTAAARHAQGAAHLADKGGIYLNNLLGDAVSFSGDVVALLELAEDIRAALASYARRLDSEGSRETVAKALAALEEKYKQRRQLLDQAIQVAEEAQRRRVPDAQSGEDAAVRLRALHAEMSRLEGEREAEIALAQGERLEAGIFISYGAAPEVATFEDHIFGSIKVSIAEKINESARGTARNGGVRSRTEAILAAERAQLGRPTLVCPLHVAVSQQLSVPVPADASAAIRSALGQGDMDAAATVLGGVMRDFLGKLDWQQMHDDRGDIYNGGAALSEDALEAYVAACGDDALFLRREVPVSDLAPLLRERFVFPARTLRLVMAVSPASHALQRLFVFVGRALFKGLEKQDGLGVYEMIARDNPFFSLLAQHHLARWVAEHEAGTWAEADDGSPVLLRRVT
jgi:hypothetical protein